MKKYILVAGVDFDFKGKGVNFRLLCNNRMKRIISREKKRREDMIFTIFDFKEGEVETHKITYPKGKILDERSKLTPPFKPISITNYYTTKDEKNEIHYHFKDCQSGFMTILDIYKAVQNIGTDAPNTLYELSFFSHGWWDGPLLVNSDDDGEVKNCIIPPSTTPVSYLLPSLARDPYDMDTRGDKDFSAPTMDPIKLSNFQNAFHTDGIIWIWGCNFNRVAHEILSKIQRHPSYRSHGVPDDKIFKITNFNPEQATLLEDWLRDDIGGRFPDKKNIEIKFKFLKHFFCANIEATYIHNIAKNSKVKTYGTLVGMYSTYDTGFLPLMSVYKGLGLWRHLEFYKNYLGFTFDPEGRNYGEYKPDFTCTAPSP